MPASIACAAGLEAGLEARAPVQAHGSRAAARNGKDHVFPEQAAMCRENPDGITWRVKKVLAIALSASNPFSASNGEKVAEGRMR
jgi:hypothetical protein